MAFGLPTMPGGRSTSTEWTASSGPGELRPSTTASGLIGSENENEKSGCEPAWRVHCGGS